MMLEACTEQEQKLEQKNLDKDQGRMDRRICKVEAKYHDLALRGQPELEDFLINECRLVM